MTSGRRQPDLNLTEPRRFARWKHFFVLRTDFGDKIKVMQVQLNNPELEKYIDEQIEAGHFPTREAAIEAAVECMMLEGQAFENLDPATREAIERAEAQAQRGEGIPADQAFALLRSK